jgi:antitoxin (DNA-binding transcriptional repressor) of toxin-antitoxin stability system
MQRYGRDKPRKRAAWVFFSNQVDQVNHLAYLCPMKMIATNEAKTHLSALIQAAQRGESVIISRGQKPVAQLVAYPDPGRARPKVGEMIDQPMHVPDEAWAPLSDQEREQWGL